MGQKNLKVKFISMTNDAVNLIYSSCRQCYSNKFAADVFCKKDEKNIGGDKKKEDFIKKIIKSGHESPLEHVSFSFAVEGISRACSHQLVRHRLASYSQQSQRYVRATDFDYVVPFSIKNDPELLKIFEKSIHTCQEDYKRLIELFEAKGIIKEQANQDARFLLPMAVETKIVITMNCRELLHFFKVRCCNRTQWELRNLANRMLKITKEKVPCVFERAGAKCESLGYCPEGEKFNCGKYPLGPKLK
ncbi:FAD-dependent thymidylate synthase [bacterium]|nr:FAD-dependent thymidylate synthase [bacterium]